MKAKICQQCGELRPENTYRQYYGMGRKGKYKTCKICEKVNNRHKYLTRKASSEVLTDGMATAHIGLSVAESQELQKIEQLYELQRERGLKPPGSREEVPIDLDALIAQQQAELDRVPDEVPTHTPPVLLDWLERDLTQFSEETLEETLDNLIAAYRPQIGFNEDLTPTYDNTYRDVLNTIQRRFEDYIDTL